MALEPWTTERWQELDLLRQLLADCERIDNGSGIIARLQRITEAAKKLNSTDYKATPVHPSLISFLEQQALMALTPRKDGDE